MKFAAFRMICRFLIASLLALSFTTASAGMIGVDQMSAASAGAQADRIALMNLVARSEVANQLQAQGVDPQMAQERIASMTDSEIAALKGQVDALPAGATSGWAWAAAVIVVALIVWYFWMR
jgi:hypothetical protein